MRTIKFRGKKLENGEWLYGDLVQDDRDCCYIYPNDCDGLYANNKVGTDTIGQFTGLLDKNGEEIYEGDILEVGGMYAKVVWNKEKASFEYEYLHPTQIANTFYEFNMPYLTIVGNIHDNKELIKGE
jgi:YopX protein.